MSKWEKLARTTIKDIARQLNINPSTVSRALHNHPDVSVLVKENVKALAAKLGYRPNYLAVNLRKGKSFTIGLIIPEISMFFFPSVIKAVEEEARARGYNLLVLHSNDSIDREIENAEICVQAGVDGILVSLTRQSKEIEHFQDLSNADIPVVYFDKVLLNINSHKVIIPGEQAAFIAVQKLISQKRGIKKIYGLFGDPQLSITNDRVEGFKKALIENGYKENNENILYAISTTEASIRFTELWEKNKPDALFIMSDEILAGVIQSVNTLNLSIPGDISVISLSDGFLPSIISFDFPYIKTSGYTLGKTASVLLFNLISRMPIAPDTHFIDIPYYESKREEKIKKD